MVLLTAVAMKDSMIVEVLYVEKTQEGSFAYLAHYYHGHMMFRRCCNAYSKGVLYRN